MANAPIKKTVEMLSHEEAKRKNIPTAEYQSVLQKNEQDPVRVACTRVRDHLIVTCVEPASEFLDDLQKK